MSVCIVHKDGWAVADSRDSIGNLIVPSTPVKVSKAEGYLIAVVGAGILGQKVNKIVKTQGHELSVIDTIAEMIGESDQDGEMLAVSLDRKLIHIDGHGLMSNLDVDFWAVGCAECYVLGRLHLVAEMNGSVVTIEDAEQAVVAASVYDSGVDARVQRFFLDRSV